MNITRFKKRSKKLAKIILKAIFLERVFFRITFLWRISRALRGCCTILEVGAGKSSYLRNLNRKLHITAIEISEKAILQAQEQCVYDEYIHADVRHLANLQQQFDAVVAFDFIEHLEKADGLKFLEQAEKIARKKVIIYTPNGFLPQQAFDNNPFQEHLSGWDYCEMNALGYKVYGINGHKKLRGQYSAPIIRPVELGNFISNITALVLWLLRTEKKSFSILGVKKVTTKK